nr:ribonuclease H-like domain-containing protein [Tanacetum cinerariifolium]
NPTTLGDPQVPMFLLHFLTAGYPNRPLKFLGTVKFGNDHVTKRTGYGDYQIGNVTISRVYCVEGLGHNLFSVGQFSCAMGKSTKKTHKPKSEDTNQEKLYLLHMDLCGPMRVESVNGKKYIIVIVDDYSRFTCVKFLRSKDETPTFINKFLKMIQVPPSRNDWDLLFQPLFDELLNPPPSVDNQAAEVIAPIAEVIPQVDDDSTGSPSSTTVDQDAPSPSKSLTPTEIQSSVIPQDVGNDNLDTEVAHMGNDPLLGVPIPEVNSEQSSLTASPQSNVQPNHPMTHHNSK